MSLVGTRPILQDELRQYELHHRARIAIKPGITGMWQVSGRSDITDFEEVVRLDTEYISKCLTIVRHVMGRTEWDKACVKLINPNCRYHHSNETLRDQFYSGKWSYNECTRHTIFASQALLPLKGLHILLKAAYMIKDKYPDLKIKVAGQNIVEGNWLNGSSYGLYVGKLIREYELENSVKFIGPQNAEQMKGTFNDRK